MSKKSYCKKVGQRAKYRTPSRFRQKVYQKLIKQRGTCCVADPFQSPLIKGRSKKVFAIILLLLGCFLLVDHMQAKSWHFEKWQVDIQINKDSTFLVRETQTVNFEGAFTWFKRDIAKKDLRRISDIKVFDETGRQLTGDEVEISQKLNQASIKINFNAAGTAQIWTFEYLVHGGLGFFNDYDELYWNAVSSQRDVVINDVDVLVHLPEPIESSQIKQRILLGKTGSKQESNNFQFVDEKTFHFWGQDIAPDENFTIVAGWPKGIIEQSWQDKYLVYLNYLWLILPIVVFVFLFKHWWQYGRDPKLKGTIIAQYEPPKDLTPAEMAVIINQQLQPKDISATIIDLACRGYLKIIETLAKGIFTVKTDYHLIKQKEFLKDSNLKEHETLILTELFHNKNEINIKDLKNKFYRSMPVIKKRIFDQIVFSGYFKNDPSKVRKKYLVIGFVVLLAGFLLSAFISTSVFTLIAVFACGVIILIFALFMPSLTSKGAQAKWHALGFREYLQVAERFRLQDLTPKTFERYLSYAMVFGVEKKWAARFSDIYRQPPDWYVPVAPYLHFSAISFANQISSVSNSFTSSLFSSPGSRASGFGGGGFAGGGGGGGGSSAG